MAGLFGRRRRRARGERPGPPTCARCARPLELGRLYDVRGWAGDCSVALHGLPCLMCPDKTHSKRWAEPDYGSKLRDALLRGDSAPVARPRGLRRARCTACGRRLRRSPAARGTVSAELRVAGAEFTVEIAAPLVSCARCGAEQVPPSRDLQRRLAEALDRALARAGLTT